MSAPSLVERYVLGRPWPALDIPQASLALQIVVRAWLAAERRVVTWQLFVAALVAVNLAVQGGVFAVLAVAGAGVMIATSRAYVRALGRQVDAMQADYDQVMRETGR